MIASIPTADDHIIRRFCLSLPGICGIIMLILYWEGVLLLILGIDPGYAIVGFGLVESAQGRYRLSACGAINTPAGVRLPARLWRIASDLEELIGQFHPDVMAIEELFFNHNVTTGIGVAQARGVILMTAEKMGLPVCGGLWQG